MIIADKIIRLRKKNGWSQEELANKVNVSRQAVSKWESAQTIPDLEKVLQLSTLFGVTTDFLLKDEIEDEELKKDEISSSVKKISFDDAKTYIRFRKRAAWCIAIATLLCILSPVSIIVLTSLSELSSSLISQTMAVMVGLVVFFILILCAVPIFIYFGFQNEKYAFLDKNIPFEIEYGVKNFVNEKKNSFRTRYVNCNIIATILCILSVVPLILSSFTKNEILVIIMLAALIVVVGVAVLMFIVVEVQNASMQKLLQEGEFTKQEKKRSRVRETVGFAYWGILAAIYLAVSFWANGWQFSWIIFAVGGVLFPIVMCVCNCFADKQDKD